MAEGLKREASEDPFADLLAASYEASPGSRRLMVGASVAMGDESAGPGRGAPTQARKGPGRPGWFGPWDGGYSEYSQYSQYPGYWSLDRYFTLVQKTSNSASTCSG